MRQDCISSVNTVFENLCVRNGFCHIKYSSEIDKKFNDIFMTIFDSQRIEHCSTILAASNSKSQQAVGIETQADDSNKNASTSGILCSLCKRDSNFSMSVSASFPTTESDWNIVSPIDSNESWAAHHICVLWAPATYENSDGSFEGISKEIKRGKKLKCSKTSCRAIGAVIGCSERRCRRSYHLPCAIEDQCQFLPDQYLIKCPKHRIISDNDDEEEKTYTTIDQQPVSSSCATTTQLRKRPRIIEEGNTVSNLNALPSFPFTLLQQQQTYTQPQPQNGIRLQDVRQSRTSYALPHTAPFAQFTLVPCYTPSQQFSAGNSIVLSHCSTEPRRSDNIVLQTQQQQQQQQHFYSSITNSTSTSDPFSLEIFGKSREEEESHHRHFNSNQINNNRSTHGLIIIEPPPKSNIS